MLYNEYAIKNRLHCKYITPSLEVRSPNEPRFMSKGCFLLQKLNKILQLKNFFEKILEKNAYM